MGRLAIVVAAVATAAGLFVLLRPSADAPPPATGPVPAPQVQPIGTATQPVRPRTTRTLPVPTAVNVTLVVRGGAPAGRRPRRLNVEQGRTIALTVDSDVADTVHVHGYDLTRRVSPGGPSRLVFDADIAGRFEIELEQRHVQIAELEVRP